MAFATKAKKIFFRRKPVKVFKLIDYNGAKFQIHKITSQTPVLLSDGLFVFHNPNAYTPLDENALPYTTNFSYENNEINLSGVEQPLISRLNIPSVMEKAYWPFIAEQIAKWNDLDISKVIKF